MARLIVQFPDDAAVVVDGTAAGRTNRVIALAEGEHVVSLDADSEPAERTVAAPAGDEAVAAAVHARLEAGESARDAAAHVAAELGVPRRRAYDAAVRLSRT